MKIKSFLLAFAFFGLAGTVAFAQSKAPKAPEYKPSADPFDDAKGAYEQYDKLKDVGGDIAVSYLKNAKKAIDKAMGDEANAKKADTWAYKAMIYSGLALNDSVETKAAPLYKAANEAIQKATELDAKGKQKKNIEAAKATLALFPERISAYTINKGVRDYQAKDYAAAFTAFNNALKYRPGDTTITYYAGLSAINAKDYKGAISSYEALTKTNYSANRQIYLDLSRLYAMQGDTVKAIATASEGAKKFASDEALATQEIELSLMSGKEKEVIARIEEMAKANPTNKLYPYYLGFSYGTIKDKEKAEAAYKKAIEIDPKYAEAYIGLGATILNRGIDLNNTANKIPQNKPAEYAAMRKQATAEFERALPYLQKAVELSPKSKIALENLKTYYLFKNNQAKVDELTKAINAM